MGKVMWIWHPEDGRPELYSEADQNMYSWRTGGKWVRVVIIPLEVLE